MVDDQLERPCVFRLLEIIDACRYLWIFSQRTRPIAGPRMSSNETADFNLCARKYLSRSRSKINFGPGPRYFIGFSSVINSTASVRESITAVFNGARVLTTSREESPETRTDRWNFRKSLRDLRSPWNTETFHVLNSATEQLIFSPRTSKPMQNFYYLNELCVTDCSDVCLLGCESSEIFNFLGGETSVS